MTTPQFVECPPGPLGRTVLALSEQFETPIVASGVLLENKQAPGISGSFTLPQALALALDGHGLRASVAENGGISIVAGASRDRAARRETSGAATSGPQDSPPRLEQVVVYGIKEPLTLQQVTASADLFSAERIERESLFQLSDVIQRTPNVSGSLENLTIRGIARGSNAGSGGAPSRGVTSNIYIDGAPVSTTALQGGAFNSLWDVAQTEVLRGPQSSIQGRNALAGAVFIATKDPTYEWDARARVNIAEFGTEQYAAYVSGPVVDEQLAFRFTVDQQKTDGFIDDARTGADDDTQDRLLLRGKLLYEPESLPGLRAELIAEYTDSQQGGGPRVFGPGQVGTPEFGDFDFRERNSFVSPVSNDSETRRFITDLSYELSAAQSVRFIGTYEDAETTTINGNLEDPSLFLFNRISDGDAQTFSLELQWVVDTDRLSSMLGVYYFDDQDSLDTTEVQALANQGFPVTPSSSQLRLVQTADGSTRNYALFAQARYALSKRWELSLGLRYDNEEVELFTSPVSRVEVSPADCLITIPGIVVGSSEALVEAPCLDTILRFSPPQNDPLQQVEFDAWLPRAALSYDINDDASIFASAQRGYRAGGSYLRIDVARLPPLFVDTFDPEFLLDYELGFRSQWLNDALRVNGNLFFSVFEDQQIFVPGPSGVPLDVEVLNAAESENYGLELSAEYLLNSSWTLFGSLGLLHAEFSDFPYGDPGSGVENLAGNTPPFAASASANLGASFQGANGLFADLSIAYRGPVESDIANVRASDNAFGISERTSSLVLANARLGYRQEHYLVSAYATNLFDEDSASGINVGSQTRSGEFSRFFNPVWNIPQPRTVGLLIELGL